jgi:hypothetical protein
MYIIPRMRARVRLALAGLLLFTIAAACRNPLGREYEYEEQLYLQVNGSATVIVDASIPSLVALRGLAFDTSFATRPDRAAIRKVVEAGGCPAVTVGQPWTRHGRRFVQIRIATKDVRTLAGCALLSWSTYALDPDPESRDTLRYRQTVGAAANGNPGDPKWTGKELVGFKLHMPSKITLHNVKLLDTGENGTVERGNILTYEQRLTDRRAGTPLEMNVEMGSQSILYHTLFLFAGAFAAAVVALAVTVWLTVRHGRRQARGKGLET